MPITGSVNHPRLSDQVYKARLSVGNAKINAGNIPMLDSTLKTKAAAIFNFSNPGEMTDPTQS
jgi:hypothetical protein